MTDYQTFVEEDKIGFTSEYHLIPEWRKSGPTYTDAMFYTKFEWFELDLNSQSYELRSTEVVASCCMLLQEGLVLLPHGDIMKTDHYKEILKQNLKILAKKVWFWDPEGL